MTKLQQVIEALERQGSNAKFISLTYRAKESGELARHTLIVNADYMEVCRKDILELNLRLGNAKGIEAMVIKDRIASLEESILARQEGRFHEHYTKPGIYRFVCPGVAVNLNDNSFELRGLSHAKVVIEPGVHKAKNYRTEETRLKDVIRKTLKSGTYRSFCLESPQAELAKINGEVIEF